MTGIRSLGAYIPIYRLARTEIARAWELGRAKGEKAVANFDEDTVTMAVEACRDCLKGIDRQQVDGLYFASTTSPYLEKQASALIATVLDLKREVTTIDFTNSLRASTNALKAALDAVQAGTAENILVVGADCRLGVPGSDLEQLFGDGAVALLVSAHGPIEITGIYTHTDEILDNWRIQGQTFVKSWEDRFVITQGFLSNVLESVKKASAALNMNPVDVTRVVLTAPDARRHQEASRALNIRPEQLQEHFLDQIGNIGTAHSFLMLVAALEKSKPGDTYLLINYGDGCDVFRLAVREQLVPAQGWRGVNGLLNSKLPLSNYEKYIRMHHLMPVETGRRRPPYVSSAAILHRDRKMVLSLHASKCRNCGRLFFPPQRICLYCHAKDQYEEVNISDSRGTLFTFTKDELAQSIDPPVIISLVDLEAGLRFYGQMTDRDPNLVELDMPVEFTFRRINEAEGFYNYFWKCRPIR